MDTNWTDWTSCETYGHVFVEGRCSDCGEEDGGEVVTKTMGNVRVRKLNAEEAALIRERIREYNERVNNMVVFNTDELIEALGGLGDEAPA